MIRTPRKPTRATVPTEHQEAVELMRLVHLHEPQHPVLLRFFHCPNGGKRSKAAAGKLKAEGVRPGVPDFLLPASGYAKERGMYDRYVGLAIELKRRKGGAVSAAQRDWIEYLSDAGWRVVVADGHERAWACICEYLGIRNCLETGS